MNETGDQFETQSLTNGLKSLDINSIEILNELIEDIKDKCESMVNNDSNNNAEKVTDVGDDSQLFRRVNDSEAEVNERVYNQPVGQRDEVSEDINKDIIKDESNCGETVRVTIVSTEPNVQTTGLALHKFNKTIQLKPRTEKWGESVGIVDESGRVKRIISLKELHNYLILETLSQRLESKIYCSLINERYPRFFDSTIDYLQRWRMRYNVFVDKVLADKSDDSLLHIGELHLYFDLIPRYPHPSYVNNSFYSNPNDAEKPLDLERYQKMKSVFDSVRKSQSIFQLRFPIRLYLFHSTDNIFEKFRERHHEIMDESRAVHRKGVLRSKRQKSNGPSGPSMRGSMSRDRDFGQSSRDFHQTGRQFPRNQRKFSEMGQGFAATERQELEESQRSFGGNRRGFGRGRADRSFSATNRKPFNPKPKSMNDGRRRRTDSENSAEMDVTFEDTRERHERSGVKSTFGKPHKAMNRNDRIERVSDPHMDAFRNNRGPIMGPNERNPRTNSRPMDSDIRRQNRDGFKGKDSHFSNYTPATGALFSTPDMENNRYSNSVNSGYVQPTGFPGCGSFN